MKLRVAVLALVSFVLVLAWALPGLLRVESVAGERVASSDAVPGGHVHGGDHATDLSPAAVAHGQVAMDEAAMRRWADAYWATLPRVGSSATNRALSTPGRTTVVGATVNVGGTTFDADGNIETQIDTVKINVGETVGWQWVEGIHTITSGTGSEDPNAGLLFLQPMDFKNYEFFFTFNSAGVVPYYCSPHELFDMKGVVVVSAPVGVTPAPGAGAIGFASLPQPNPSSAGVRFAFTLAEPGRVRADVMDVRGRYVATILDRDYAPGTHDAVWDGLGAAGRVPPGAYYLRLLVPGFTGGRTFVISR